MVSIKKRNTQSASSNSFSRLLFYPDLENIEPRVELVERSDGTVEKVIRPPRFRTQLHALLHDDNPYLFSGYRRMPIDSLWRCLVSVFQLHNETMNIHTHFLPLFLWLYFLVWHILPHTEEEMAWADKAVFVYYLLGASCTMILSAMYHTWRANSVPCYHFCLACDLRGIIMLLSGCNTLLVYFELSCWPFWRNVYLTVNFAALLALALWIPHMVKHRLTNQRTVYFAIFSFIGLIAWIHRVFLLVQDPQHVIWEDGATGARVTQHDLSMMLFWRVLFVSYMVTLLGIVVRSVKAPERFFPYKFDIFVRLLMHIYTYTYIRDMHGTCSLWDSLSLSLFI